MHDGDVEDADPLGPGAEAQPVDVVLSVGKLDGVVVALREFLHRSGALRAVALLPDPAGDQGSPALVDCAQLAPVEVTRAGGTVHLPHAVALNAAPAAAVPQVRQLPPFEVDREEGRIASVLGGLEHHALAVRELATGLGPQAVAMATFTTTDADSPLSITARLGDAMVLAIGEDEYEMEPGWPA